MTHILKLKIHVSVNELFINNSFITGHKIQSDAVKGTLIGQLSVMDEDADQSHTFSLVSGGDGKFLVSNEGQVTKSTDQLLESGNVYDIVVQAVDSGQPQLKVYA